MRDYHFRLMLDLIRQYAEEDLDQWDLFQLETKHGPIYVEILRGLKGPEMYRKL